MTTPFGPVYAEHYDLFYQHKDYEAECTFVEAVFQRFAGQPVRSILDLGCGTGGHALRLAQRGYVVTGVDRSAAMLAEARQEAERSGITRTRGQAEWSGQRLEFFSGDVRSLHLDKTYDAAIMMFAVLSYQTTNDDLAAAFACVRRHLTPGGLLVADFWYGPAVLAQRPNDRVQEWSEQGARLLRIVRSRLDVSRQTVEVRYTVLRLQDDLLQAETDEAHDMRFLFPQELAYFARVAGLELVWLCPFLELDNIVDESTWNVTAIMRAIPT